MPAVLQTTGSNRSVRSLRLLNLRLAELGWLLAINGLLFESFLATTISVAGYLDEVATVLLLMCAVASACSNASKGARVLSMAERMSIVVLCALVGIGLLSGIVSSIQLDPVPVLIDILACAKFPVALLSGFVVFAKYSDLFEVLAIEAKILLVVMLPFAVLNQFVDMGMRFDYRYGLYSFEFVFGHPSSLAAVMASFSVLFFAKERGSIIWLTFCWVYLILTLRSTAIAFSALSCLAYLTSRKRGHISVWQVAAFALIALFLGWGQIQYYFFELEGSARRELLDVGLQIAARFFPLGSGFATYASNITSQADYYSPLYYEYGLSGIYGLTPTNSNFLSDSFWPIIFGQFGWVGTIVFVALLLFLYVGCCSRLRKDALSVLPVSIGYIYLFVSSMSSSSFFHPMSVLLSVCISLTVCYQLGRVDQR